MHFANLRIVFEADVKSRMNAINERRPHRCPVDLAGQKPYSGGEFLWVIGCPPDSLAFARSDRSGRNERAVFRFCLFSLCYLCRFRNFRKQYRIELFSKLQRFDYPDLAPNDLALTVDNNGCR